MVVVVFVFFDSFFAHDVLFMGKEVCKFLCNWVFEFCFLWIVFIREFRKSLLLLVLYVLLGVRLLLFLMLFFLFCLSLGMVVLIRS